MVRLLCILSGGSAIHVRYDYYVYSRHGHCWEPAALYLPPLFHPCLVTPPPQGRHLVPHQTCPLRHSSPSFSLSLHPLHFSSRRDPRRVAGSSRPAALCSSHGSVQDKNGSPLKHPDRCPHNTLIFLIDSWIIFTFRNCRVISWSAWLLVTVFTYK